MERGRVADPEQRPEPERGEHGGKPPERREDGRTSKERQPEEPARRKGMETELELEL